jgi:hypothetical protein
MLLILASLPLLGAIMILGLPARDIRENQNRDKEIALTVSLITF